MTAYVFDSILTRGVKANQIPARTQQARDWYRQTAKTTTNVNRVALLEKNKSKLTNVIMTGKMYMFFYDPKYKDTLPFYDRFPMVFPFRKVPGGFLGINLHYLPLPLRAKLMDGLYQLTTNQTYDESTRLRISYQILSNVAKLRFFKPCVKHYLTQHVKSRFLLVDSVEWDIALFLPLEKFEKSTKREVWQNSKEQLNVV